MKKFNGKLIAGVLMAGIMAASASVTSSAIIDDYWRDDAPNNDAPAAVATTTKKGDVAGATADSATPVVSKTVVDDALKNAKDGKATIYVEPSKNGKITITEEAMSEISKSGTIVEFVADGYTVAIDPETIEDIRAINIAMQIEVTEKGTEINGVTIPAGSFIIKTGMKYKYGMELTITLNKSDMKDIVSGEAKLYSIDHDGTVAKDITEELTVNSDYSATIKLSHGAILIISKDEIESADASYEAAAVEEAGVEDAKSDNAPIVIFGDNDMNPGTGVGLALGALALSAAAVAVTKKRK
jgi:hypothetical protein